MRDPAKQFTLVRDFDAPPERVWRAWVEPDVMASWLHPNGLSTRRDSVSVDLRVGGRYAYTMVHDATGQEHPSAGTFVELDEPHRLVLTWADPSADDEEAPLVTVDLKAIAGGTRMTFTLQGIAGHEGDDDVYDGWSEALAHLAGALGATA